MRRSLPISFLVVVVAASLVWGQSAKQKSRAADQRQTEVYKTVDDVQLKMNIYNPPGHKPSDQRAAVVFFFGGGWSGGSTRQFDKQCQYLASRGMVAMAADYRVYSRQKAKVVQCVADAKSAIRWVRCNAERLGIDPERIAAGGGSAGGHLAAATGTLDGFDEEGENTATSARPNAMLLFNPALDLTEEAFGWQPDSGRYESFVRRFGAEPQQLSPNCHVKRGVPPAIVFHGKQDTLVPYAQAERFAELMKEVGNRCELAGFEGEPHGFFNYGRKGNKAFVATMRQADRFLASLGYLSGEPTIDQFGGE